MKLIVGAGGTTQPGWLSLNESDLDITDAAQWAERFAPNSLDAIVAEHVWEHLTPEEGIKAAQNCNRYLKRGGVLRIAVPDELHPSEGYWFWCAPEVGFNGDDHKVFYNYQSLCWVLRHAGFQCYPREFFNERGELTSGFLDDEYGYIKRTAQSYPQTLEGRLLKLWIGADYSSLIVDGLKR